jgi:hypothetical protein
MNACRSVRPGRLTDPGAAGQAAHDPRGAVPPLRVMTRVRCPLDAQVLDVGTGGFGDPQPVERQQGDQRMLTRRAQRGGDQQGAQLVAVQPRPAHMRRWRVIEQVFLDGVPVEPGDCAQPPGNGCPCAAAGLQVAGEAFDVGVAGLEEAQVVLVAPAGVLAQVQFVRLAGRAAVAG